MKELKLPRDRLLYETEQKMLTDTQKDCPICWGYGVLVYKPSLLDLLKGKRWSFSHCVWCDGEGTNAAALRRQLRLSHAAAQHVLGSLTKDLAKVAGPNDRRYITGSTIASRRAPSTRAYRGGGAGGSSGGRGPGVH